MWTRTRQRLTATRATLSRRSSAAAAAIATIIGADELGVALALGVLGVGLWPRFGRDTLIVIGVVLLWMFLPARSPFIVGPLAKDERKKD